VVGKIFVPCQGDDRGDPWLALLGNMTGVPRTSVHTVDNAVHTAATDVAKPYGWRIWCSQDEVPYCEEERTPHDGAELLRASQIAARSCDAVLCRIVEYGSMMLGDLFEIAVSAPHAPPVAICVPKDQLVSKLLPCFEEEHPQVKLIHWGDLVDLHQKVHDWLEANGEAIEAGQTRRQEIVADYEPIGRALVHAWKVADGRERQAAMTGLMRTRDATLRLFGDPLHLAMIGDNRLDVACNALGVDVNAVRVMAAAQRCLDDDEREAWYVWSRNKSPDFALGVLKSAVLARPVGTINRTDRRLNHVGAWEQQARSHSTGGTI
jgi:hypothetical protein